MNGVQVSALVVAALLVGYAAAPRTREIVLGQNVWAEVPSPEGKICVDFDAATVHGVDDQWAVVAIGPDGETLVAGIFIDLSAPPTLAGRAREAWWAVKNTIAEELDRAREALSAPAPDPCESTNIEEPCS